MNEEYYYEIEEIEECVQEEDFQEEYVYDIEVGDDTHTFIANDILVHNSLYITYQPIMNSCGYEGEGLEFILSLNRIFVEDLFEKYLDEYAEKYKVKNIHEFELETVNHSSLHLQKKMYLANTIWEEGITFQDRTNYIPKGIDIVRSSTPAFVRGKRQKGGIWEFVNYLFKEAGNINSRDALKILKDLKSQFVLADIEDISFTTTVSNYEHKVFDDQSSMKCEKGCHFSIKAAALHNYLLNKHSDLKSKYDLIKGGKIKWYFIKDYPLNDRFGYLRSFHPYEIVEKEKIQIDYDRMFEEGMLGIVNRLVRPVGLPEINRRLGILNSLFDGENIGDVWESKNENGEDFEDIDDWDVDFDF